MRPILMKGHERPLTLLKYNHLCVFGSSISGDSMRLITGSEDQTATLWNVQTGQQLYSFNFDSPARAVDFSVGDMLASGKLIKESDKESGHKKTVTCLTISANGSHFITGYLDKSARLWDIRTLTLIKRYVPQRTVNAVIRTYVTERPVNEVTMSPLLDHEVLGGGRYASTVTTTDHRAGKFEAKFYDITHKHCEERPESLVGSPCRVQKLIASQSDPLLAKEIFDYACRQPHFRPSSSSYLILILKLGRSKYFSLIDDLLLTLKSNGYPVTSTLFSHIIKIYGEADLPEKALKTFYTMIEFGCQPSTKQLNRVLEILVSHRNFIVPAFAVFKNGRHYGVFPNTKSYNILMRAFCRNGDVSVAYTLFNKMFKRDVSPDVESYRILMQGLCRKNQVNGAVDLLEDMLNKGYVPDTLSYATLLNSLCRKKKLKEAYKLLCRMKVKGCNPDIAHYNTVITGFCRQGRALDACKILEDMQSNGCLPNLVSYQILSNGLCDEGMFELSKDYVEEMISKGFRPHFSLVHSLVKGLCNVGRIDESCSVIEDMLKLGKAPHSDTWEIIISGICEVEDTTELDEILEKILRKVIRRDIRIVEAGGGLGEYLIRKLKSKSRRD